MSLPKGYKRLEYIQSSGTQYIDTSFKPNQNTRVVCDFQFTDTASTQYLFAARGPSSAYANRFGFLLHSSGYFRSDYGSGNVNFPSGVALDERHTVDKNGATVFIGAASVQNVAATFVSAYNLVLFAGNTGGTVREFSKAKIYSCQIYDNGLLERDYIPAMLSNGEVGLYDRVYHAFYRNAGTGEFIAGPEAATTPKAPANFRVESETDTLVTPAWDVSDKAVGYRLYRPGQLLADTTETSVTVTVEPFAGAVFPLKAYNENGEGAAAELAYFNAPENPILYLITDRTQADVDAGNEKGIYQASDLNRVGAAMNYVAERLTEFGYDPHISPKTDWEDTDWMTVSDGERYLADLSKLRSQIAVFSTTPEVPPRLTATGPQAKDGLNYERANDIEKILEDIDRLLSLILTNLLYAGEIFSGEV